MTAKWALHVMIEVSYGVQIETRDWEIDPDLGRGGVFSTKALAKDYMKKLAHELYWTAMVGYELKDEEDEDYPIPPPEAEFSRYYREQEIIITFGSEAFYDEMEHRSGFVKYTKMHIDNVVLRVPEETTNNKKRKA
ncbi:hypothetical protein MUCCIDRAFT_86758 [Mucor lusitanicus CBS 277.49]|uniref:Uncharacterized protein n=1 Tax=Mucor lusitanicus CBS 277.49 TaxID=747725 RepID=A0A168GP95_MUCCL|nr:hypothetical protein MUCCIDRAFT_86758 [Mucor lusitanicus CBS 277.49]